MTNPKYVGRPWRSRFLRAPKFALDLAGKAGFVRLADVASVSLGLKTGADDFFYLEPIVPVPTGTRFGEGGSRRELAVRGYRGWEGHVSARDLLPVVRNSHELIRDGRRAAAIPSRTPAFYLYPRAREPDGDLAAYIRRGVDEGVHQGKLVRSNADSKWWFRQVRGVVRPAWVLPYNSSYDYVAWENPDRAVINGRFVGVEPSAGIEGELLGAILNSTFVAATRLLEGVTTGSEGAYDVGPPAAREMRVPDPRVFVVGAATAATIALAEIRGSGTMAPAPDREGKTGEMRHRLDLAVARGLGLGAGEAAMLVGRLYESYARWRGAVEDVEAAVRVNRRAAHRAGTTRGDSPIQGAARRTWEQIAAATRLFPRDLLKPDDELDLVNATRKIQFAKQTPLFEPGLVDVGDATVDLRSWDRVLYLQMLVSLGYQSPYFVPSSPARAAAVIRAYDEERLAVRAQAQDVARIFVTARDLDQVVSATERLWMRACRAAGMSYRDGEEAHLADTEVSSEPSHTMEAQ